MHENLPSILPDECLKGYGFRIAATNQWPPGYLSKLLLQIAEATQLSLGYLAQHHSHLGYRRFVNGQYFQQPLEQHNDLYTNRRNYACDLPINRPRLCESCVEEDISFHGISYWRRAHQLPGVDHCTKHEISLTEVRDTSLQTCLPQNALTYGKSVSVLNFKKYFECEKIQNFVALSDFALLSSVPLKPEVISRVLSNQVKVVLGKGRGLLRGKALDCFPEDWLNRHFPTIYKKDLTAETIAIDEVLKSSRYAYATKTYLLAMALLWDRPEQAINACQHEVKNNTSGFNEKGGQKALQEVLYGKSITWACRKHDVQLIDFEYALQNLLRVIRPQIEQLNLLSNSTQISNDRK